MKNEAQMDWFMSWAGGDFSTTDRPVIAPVATVPKRNVPAWRSIRFILVGAPIWLHDVITKIGTDHPNAIFEERWNPATDPARLVAQTRVNELLTVAVFPDGISATSRNTQLHNDPRIIFVSRLLARREEVSRIKGYRFLRFRFFFSSRAGSSVYEMFRLDPFDSAANVFAANRATVEIRLNALANKCLTSPAAEKRMPV